MIDQTKVQINKKKFKNKKMGNKNFCKCESDNTLDSFYGINKPKTNWNNFYLIVYKKKIKSSIVSCVLKFLNFRTISCIIPFINKNYYFFFNLNEGFWRYLCQRDYYLVEMEGSWKKTYRNFNMVFLRIHCLLKRNIIFSNFRDTFLMKICRKSIRVTTKKTMVLLENHEVCNEFYFLLRGVFVNSKSERQYIGIFNADVKGIPLKHSELTPAGYRWSHAAKNRKILWWLKKEDIFELIEREASLAERFHFEELLGINFEDYPLHMKRLCNNLTKFNFVDVKILCF